MNKFLRLVWLLLLWGGLNGCGAPPEAELLPTEEAVATVEEATVLPTVTILPRITPTERPSQLLLEERWRLPIVVSALNYGICTETQRTLTDLQPEAGERPEVVARLETLDSFLGIVDESLSEWQPTDEPLVSLREPLIANTAVIGGALSGWLSEEMDRTAALETLEEACATADQTGEAISREAVTAGFNQTALRDLLNEVQSTLATALSSAAEEGE